MRKIINTIFGSLILAGIGYYFYSTNNQIDGIKSICSVYKEGKPAKKFEENAHKFDVEYMGTTEVREKPGTKSVIFCSSLTMCDSSCMIEFKNNKITKVNLR